MNKTTIKLLSQLTFFPNLFGRNVLLFLFMGFLLPNVFYSQSFQRKSTSENTVEIFVSSSATIISEDSLFNHSQIVIIDDNLKLEKEQVLSIKKEKLAKRRPINIISSETKSNTKKVTKRRFASSKMKVELYNTSGSDTQFVKLNKQPHTSLRQKRYTSSAYINHFDDDSIPVNWLFASVFSDVKIARDENKKKLYIVRPPPLLG